MPKKNNVPLADGSEAAPENVVMGKEGFEAIPCGHVNKQHYNTKGRLEDLTCTLPKGHPGDHFATAMKNVPDHVYDMKGAAIQQKWNEVEAEVFWSDAAGTPAKDIKEKEIPQLSDFQKDLVASILKKNPDILVEEAIAQARNSPVWTAANA